MEDESMMARMSGALRRTPSPQQIFDGASRRVVAGVAAAGAVVGGALSSIREEDKGDFEDHSRWSEEAEDPRVRQRRAGGATSMSSSSRQTAPQRSTGGKRKSVAIVISAEVDHQDHTDQEVAYMQEHASILSHLPDHMDPDTRVFVLIYDPTLKQHPLGGSAQSARPVASLASSYSNIGHDDINTPGEETGKPLSMIDPAPISSISRSDMFDTLYTQAQALVENETMIIPFTTPTGHVHLLRHIGPEIVYIQESMSGNRGDVVAHISGWVGQVVLVVGDEGGHGGLVDSEDERDRSGDVKDRWWENDPRIGLGKGVEVVEGLRVGEDWRRRVGGHD